MNIKYSAPSYLKSISHRKQQVTQTTAPCLSAGPESSPRNFLMSQCLQCSHFSKRTVPLSYSSLTLLYQMLQLPSPMPVSFFKCFQYRNDVRKRGLNGIKDPHCIKNCHFSRSYIHIQNFFQDCYSLHYLIIIYE